MSTNEPLGNAYGPGPVGGPAYTTPTGVDPGKNLGIAGLVLAFLCSLVGLIVSIIAYNQSKKAGFKNTPALIGIIVGAVFLALGLVGYLLGGMGAFYAYQQCQQLGPGVHDVNGVTVTCS